MVYCIVPRELAAELHDLLRDHFGDDRDVEVVLDLPYDEIAGLIQETPRTTRHLHARAIRLLNR